MKITEPGFYEAFDEAAYHADPCPEPSISSGIAKIMADQSPAHARQAHPRLTVQPPQKVSVDRDIGSAVHAMIRHDGGGQEIAVFCHPDWKSGAAQKDRRAAYEAGALPMLAKEYERAEAMAAIIRPWLIDELGADYVCELVMVWREGDAWARTMIDAASRDLTRIVDLKTSGAACDADAVSKRFFSESHDTQAAWIARGLDALDPKNAGRREMTFLYIENDPPFGATPLTVTEGMIHDARDKAFVASRLWQHCMKTGEWPNYPMRKHRAEAPAWATQKWMAHRAELPPIIFQGAIK